MWRRHHHCIQSVNLVSSMCRLCSWFYCNGKTWPTSPLLKNLLTLATMLTFTHCWRYCECLILKLLDIGILLNLEPDCENLKAASFKTLFSSFYIAIVCPLVKWNIVDYPEKLGTWRIFFDRLPVFSSPPLLNLTQVEFVIKVWPWKELLLHRCHIKMFHRTSAQIKGSHAHGDKQAGIHWRDEFKLVWICMGIIEQ